MKRLLIFILTIVSSGLSGNLYAVDTVRVPTDFHVYGITNTSFELGSDAPSGDATAETAPAKVYIPVSNTLVASFPDHDKYFSKYQSGVTSLFDTTSAVASINIVEFPLTLTLSGTTQYLYGAVYNGSAYQVVRKSAPQSASSSVGLNFAMSAKEICDAYPTGCSNLSPSSATLTKGTFKLYFFISTESTIADGTTFAVTDAGKTGGVFFEVQMSNKIYKNTELKVFITNPRKGDGRVILNYDTDSSMLDFKKVIVFKHDSTTPVTTNGAIGLYTGTVIDRDFATTQSGELTINELSNGAEVTLSLAFQDKFGFASTLSDDISLTPVEIQELLKKQACFLLTAGFGEEHYVISFFRHYRDQVLARSWLGKKFIEVYYQSAPAYALAIYHSPILRFVIRVVAYILYFFFNFHWLILILCLSCYYLNLRKNKILLENNSL